MFLNTNRAIHNNSNSNHNKRDNLLVIQPTKEIKILRLIRAIVLALQDLSQEIVMQRKNLSFKFMKLAITETIFKIAELKYLKKYNKLIHIYCSLN